ncbi:ATP-dependent DNA helicase [Vibrio parahaemolyticus]|uniref:ATP-dependent DNA helicase n=1 Tax=Vibrio parahaemolyticus TaxID=670 RepID=UPI000D530E53|nr:ATP-dependent RecD-like DNA helicase [Vibrio parahaemolyticus]AWG77567.1 exonuclease V subunit alpha [Vibrio parahaemolyticus]AWJ77196.1 exonuclease V subunit alpha [Vibrio parahaemolyticus]HCZ9540484.1 AAA family ATPase [Vibrio alginolyticus]
MKSEKGRGLYRVTSLGYETEDACVIGAVAVNGDGDRVSARKYYRIKIRDTDMPVLPSIGQIWKVNAETVTTKEVVRGGAELIDVFIKAKSVRLIIPETENLFTNFIAKEPHFVGLGETLARKLWVKFQKGIYDILECGDTEKLMYVRGVTKAAAQALISGWEKYENLKKIAWFDEHDIPSGIARNIIKHHKGKAIVAIEEDPYRLISFGLNFAEVDLLAQKQFGIDSDDYVRLQGAVEQALLARMFDGHTVSRHENLMPVVESLLGSSELAAQALMAGYENTAFILSDKGHYHSIGQWIMEQTVAKRFATLATRSIWTHHYDHALEEALKDQTFPLTEKQNEAVRSALSHGMSIIAGGAGTGKTTVLNVVLRAYQALGTDIRAMALSGRAAKRINEATGFPSSTIAGFLKSLEKKPLGERALIVIDEASMVDLGTMYNLVRNTTSKVRFLLVGDPKQLAPISAGLVLHEAVNTVPTVTLDIVKRQKGSTGIPEFTKLIVDGIVPDASMFNDNIVFHHCAPGAINEYVTQLYAEQPEDTQVISAMYRGNGGIDAINQLCQQRYNPHGKRLEFEVNGTPNYLEIRENDPVLFVENNQELDVQNGTLGVILNVGSPKAETDGGEISFADVLTDTGEMIPLTLALMDSIKLAYAISLHKGQGSQFKRVIITLTNSKMLDKAWIYTALTRAEVTIELVGSMRDFENAISRLSEADTRDTYLRQLLLDELGALKEAA